MADLKTVLTETLREHLPVFDENGHINGTVPGQGAWDCWCGMVCNASEDDVLAHVADVLLGLSGVAVTQLPDADPDNDPTLYDASFKVASDDEYMTGARTPRVCIDMSAREIYTVCTPSAHISAAEARSYAAALLAAAVVLAEGKTR